MTSASFCGMPLLPSALAAAAAAAATATASSTATVSLLSGLVGVLLVIGGAVAGVRRVLLPYVRARHPNTGNVAQFNHCGAMGSVPGASRPNQSTPHVSHTGYIPGNEAGHLLQHTCNSPVIHALLLIQGTITVKHVVAVLRDAGVPHERFQRLAQCVSSRPGELRSC